MAAEGELGSPRRRGIPVRRLTEHLLAPRPTSVILACFGCFGGCPVRTSSGRAGGRGGPGRRRASGRGTRWVKSR